MKLFIGLLFLLYVFFNVFLFPKYHINSAKENLKVLDLRFSYSKDDVVELFNQQGVEGRETYSLFIRKIDMFYPLVYTLFLVLIILLFTKKLFNSNSKIKFLAVLPILAMAFDYLENFNTLILLKNYPIIYDNYVLFGSLATSSKWVFVLCSIVTSLVLFVWWIKKHFFGKKEKK